MNLIDEKDDFSFPCFFSSSERTIDCSGERTNLTTLIASSTATKDFKCTLEFLLFRAGLFSLKPTNITKHHICVNHLDHFQSYHERNKRCHVCVPIRNRRSASSGGIRRVSKYVAMAIWEEGQPLFSWSYFGKFICTSCRHFFEKKYINESMKTKCNEFFDWLYDCEIVHTPTTATPFSQGQDLDFEVEESCASEQNLPHEILEVALRETGFRHRVWTTSSFATMQQHSRTNFLAGLEKIIQHVVKIFAPDDFKDVYTSLNERWNKKLKQRIEKKYGQQSVLRESFIRTNPSDSVVISETHVIVFLIGRVKLVTVDCQKTNISSLLSFEILWLNGVPFALTFSSVLIKKLIKSDFDSIIRAMSDAWNRAESWSTRRQILSIIAPDLPSQVIQQHFPNATEWQIKIAKRHAYSFSRGAPIDSARLPTQRFSHSQIEHFIEFVLSPIISVDLPFGDRSYKLSTGEKVIVPNMIRNMIHSRIIEQYRLYCQSTTDGQFTPLGDSTLFRILQKCPAAVRKSLSGLDNISADGSTAFDDLIAICDQLVSFGASNDEMKIVKKNLHEGRNYLKLGYKLHISTSSTIADHCSTFALSDTKNEFWRRKCEHQHDDGCADCQALVDALNELMTMLVKCQPNMSVEQFSSTKMNFDKNCDLIFNWKRHQLRSVHQDLARSSVLNELDNSSIFIIMDWAMKWLETRFREKQTDWFAKKGIPWHLTVVIRRQKNVANLSTDPMSNTARFEHRTFAHVFDGCKQDSTAIISILQDVLIRLKMDDINLRFVYLRSDNGACYHNAITTTAIDEIFRNTGVFIRRIDFSEPQAGKGPCDRQAAVIKGQLRRYVDEKHDCTNSIQFVAGAKLTKYLSIFASSLSTLGTDPSFDDQIRKSTKTNWAGISSINNISYDIVREDQSETSSKIETTKKDRTNANSRSNDSGEIIIRAWRAFGIGEGKRIKMSTVKSSLNHHPYLMIDSDAQHENRTWKQESSVNDETGDTEPCEEINDDCSSDYSSSSSTDEDETINTKPLTDSNSGFTLFRCNEPNCIKWYRSFDRCEEHILSGNHIYPVSKTNLIDTAIRSYQSRIDEISQNSRLSSSKPTYVATLDNSVPSLGEGWALPKPRSNRRFNKDQITFLIDKYEEGERTGCKWNPSAVAAAMRDSTIDGRFRFPPEDQLSPSQIKSYFSKLTSERRRQSQSSIRIATAFPTPSQGSIVDDSLDLEQDDEGDDEFDSFIEESNRDDLRREINLILTSNSLSD